MKPGLLESLKRLAGRAEAPPRGVSEPVTAGSWLDLAERRRREADPRGERRALERAVDLAARPDAPDGRVILAVARRLTRLEAADASAAAWRALLRLDPHHVEARNHLAEAELYDLGGSARRRRRPRRLAVLGNCQAHGVAQCLRRLHPEVEVRALNVGSLGGPEDAALAAQQFSSFDVVISQPLGARHGPLSSAVLAQGVRRLVGFPRIYFDGFQPDMLPAGVYPRGMHSQLVLAGFAMGLPQARVAGLFNAYVYGVLGYFDAYAAAELQLSDAARRSGFDLAPLFPAWRAGGAFMHAPVHPSIRVLWSIAESLGPLLGLGPSHAEPDAPDELEPLGVWPVYPEIARRLGVPGDLTFRFKDQPPMDLEAMIARSFAAYASLDAARMREGVGEVIAILRGEGV